MEGYCSDFAGLLYFSPKPLLHFFSQREKRKHKTQNEKKKTKSQQCGSQKVKSKQDQLMFVKKKNYQ